MCCHFFCRSPTKVSYNSLSNNNSLYLHTTQSSIWSCENVTDESNVCLHLKQLLLQTSSHSLQIHVFKSCWITAAYITVLVTTLMWVFLCGRMQQLTTARQLPLLVLLLRRPSPRRPNPQLPGPLLAPGRLPNPLHPLSPLPPRPPPPLLPASRSH